MHGPVHQAPYFDGELLRAAEEAIRRRADDDSLSERRLSSDSDDDGGLLPDETCGLSTDEERLVADKTANTVNLTLARLFVRLGPPPLETGGGNFAPVSSGDGGSAR